MATRVKQLSMEVTKHNKERKTRREGEPVDSSLLHLPKIIIYVSPTWLLLLFLYFVEVYFDPKT